MWNQKQNKANKTSENRHGINRWLLEGQGMSMGETGGRDPKIHTFSNKFSHGDVICSRRNMVSNEVMSLYGVRCLLGFPGDHSSSM